ncbi:hypothetical protein ACHAO7_010761 [Fusarium culmorum]
MGRTTRRSTRTTVRQAARDDGDDEYESEEDAVSSADNPEIDVSKLDERSIKVARQINELIGVMPWD